jgi:hypothetical protein
MDDPSKSNSDDSDEKLNSGEDTDMSDAKNAFVSDSDENENEQFLDTNSNGAIDADSAEIVNDVVAVVDTPRSASPPPPLPAPLVDEKSKSPPPMATATSEHQAKLMEAANDAAMIKLQLYSQFKSLPWKPKVRLAELESFLDQERKKFFGYGDLVNDLDTMIGLPYPIQESVKILKQHLYTSLSEEQIKLEEKIAKYPLSTRENATAQDEAEENPSEVLFSALLSNLPQYLVSYISF